MYFELHFTDNSSSRILMLDERMRKADIARLLKGDAWLVAIHDDLRETVVLGTPPSGKLPPLTKRTMHGNRPRKRRGRRRSALRSTLRISSTPTES